MRNFHTIPGRLRTLLVLLVTGFAFVPHIVRAQEVPDDPTTWAAKKVVGLGGNALSKVVSTAITNVSDMMLDSIAVVVALLTEFVGIWLRWAAVLVDWGFSVGAFVDAPFVLTGWSIARDLTNIVFIFILLAIALATILRYEQYGMKKLLPKLIIVALLINFSLLGAGIVIDVGSDVGRFLVTGGAGGDVDIGGAMVNAIGVHKPFTALVDNFRPAGDTAAHGSEVLVDALSKYIFVLLATFILFAIAFVLVVRMVYLWLLLILLPFALAAIILPATEQYWKKWWTQFVQWAFIPVTLGFFIYFAVLVAGGLTDFNFGNAAPENFVHGRDGDNVFFFTFRELIQYFLVLIILFTGLIQAKNAAFQGVGLATNLGKSIRKKVKERAAQTGKVMGGSVAKQATTRYNPSTGKMELRPLAAKIARSSLGGPIVRQGLKAIKEGESDILDTMKKELPDKNKEQQQLGLSSAMGESGKEGKLRRIAYLKKIIEDGNLDELLKDSADNPILTDEDIAIVMREATEEGMEKDIISARPDIALSQNIRTSGKLREQIAKKTSKKTIEKLPKDWLEKYKDVVDPAEFDRLMEEIMRNWTSKNYGKMVEEGHSQSLEVMESWVRDQAQALATSREEALEWSHIKEAAESIDHRFANFLNSSGGMDAFNLMQPGYGAGRRP